MTVIPSINCSDERCAREKTEILKRFLPPAAFVHVDVTDGVWSDHKTWNDPQGWSAVGSALSLEVHLMVEFPLEVADDWFAAGVRRLVVHAETLNPQNLHGLLQLAERYRGELALASKPETAAEDFQMLIAHFSKFLVLSVSPGAAGQSFLPIALEKIHFLRGAVPDATIEVDGGMNLETARRVKDAGADTIISANYIFKSSDPKKAFDELSSI